MAATQGIKRRLEKLEAELAQRKRRRGRKNFYALMAVARAKWTPEDEARLQAEHASEQAERDRKEAEYEALSTEGKIAHWRKRIEESKGEWESHRDCRQPMKGYIPYHIRRWRDERSHQFSLRWCEITIMGL